MNPEKQPTPPVTQTQSLADILNEIESRAKAATPGPWEKTKHCAGLVSIGNFDGAIASVSRWRMGVQGTEEETDALAAFIASARTDLPKLVKALREACDFYEAEVGHGSFEHGNLQKRLAAILTSPENGEQQSQSLGET